MKKFLFSILFIIFILTISSCQVKIDIERIHKPIYKSWSYIATYHEWKAVCEQIRCEIDSNLITLDDVSIEDIDNDGDEDIVVKYPNRHHIWYNIIDGWVYPMNSVD